MSTVSLADDPNVDTTNSPAFVHTSTSFHYAVTHVFLPVQPPDGSDCTQENELSLARVVCVAAHAYSAHVHGTSAPQWHRITRMLDNLQTSAHYEHLDSNHAISQLRGMGTGDILVFFIRRQNAAIVLTKQEHSTLFESFEVSPSNDAVRETAGSLVCSYPWSVVETPNEVFDDGDFQFKLADSLSRPNVVDSDLPSHPTARSQYITALLTRILQGVGHTADVPRITKHVHDRVHGQHNGVWRRSPLWHLIKVTIQMSFDRSPCGRTSYKQFMLFLVCTLAKDKNNTSLPSHLLHLMSCILLRRLIKLGSLAPDWLSKMVLKTCTCLQEILDSKWQQPSARPFPFQNPSQDALRRHTQLSLLNSHGYICDALANHGHEPLSTLFHPSHHRRGTIDDFVSSNGTFFEEAYDADPDVTLYDVAESVEQGLDDWIASVTNVEEACLQLGILMDKYMDKVAQSRESWESPEKKSIVFLTAIELFVALDKLVMKEIPMLADYSPEIPIAFLEKLLLWKTASLHRLSRAYQYLSARQSRSCPGWSLLSDEFTECSFAVRYYNQSPHLQQLKARIEEDVMVTGRAMGHWQEAARFARTYDGYQEDQQQLSGLRIAEGGKASRSPLPASPLHAKVVVFELQCPTCVRVWRSAAAQILNFCSDRDSDSCDPELDEGDLLVLMRVPAFQRYFVERQVPPLELEIRFAYFYPQRSNSPTLRYVIRQNRRRYLSMEPWWPRRCYDDSELSALFRYEHENDHRADYASFTTFTSNHVLSAQVKDRPEDLSLDEFIAFGHLRSGGSLQWLNILRGLRSRTLNPRRRHVHYLLAHAAFQVGPLDSNTGMWTWHQELQDSSFCDALLDELDSLFVGAGSIDSVMMNTISLLLTRVLASCPSARILERAIELLRSVRKKMFSWVQELSYNLAMAPMNKEHSELLLDMAATYRSMLDVNPATLRKLFRSAEDVDALLSCAFFIYALCLQNVDNKSSKDRYSRLLFQRGRRLALALEGILGDVILADPSDYGVDLAVSRIFASHKPSAQRWVQLQHPNARWLTCETGAQHSQIMHLNLLNGTLRLDGQPLVRLPRAIRDSPEGQQIFRDQGFFLIPSNLPGVDFTTLTTTSKHKVHFSLRDYDLVVRAQCNQMNDIFELIPSRILMEDLPPALVKGHVHWLNLSTGIIEIRPLGRLWEQSSENWRIDYASGQYHMYRGRETLVDIRSPTWAVLAKCFECLNIEDLSNNLLITTSPIDSPHHVPVLRLSVALPHYGLSFFVNKEGELESCDFKDMVYDENQCVGTLFGLEDLLVLRPRTYLPGELIHRCILIPNGFPNRHNDHRVWVDRRHGSTELGKPLYHTYNVDTELGCLIGNGSLRSTRYLAYLHAMTSSHRPDPLTGKTGAQAAHSLLESAGCRSIMELKTLDSDRDRTLTQHQIGTGYYDEIQHMRYCNRSLDRHAKISWGDECAARRPAWRFPWHATASGTTPPEDCNYDDSDHSTARLPAKPGLPIPPCAISPPRDIPNHLTPWLIMLDQLLFNRPAPELPARSTLPRHSSKASPDDIPQLNELLSLLMSKSNPSFQREYITRLNTSAQRVREEWRTTYGVAGDNRIEALHKHYAQCRINYMDALDILKETLRPTTDLHEQALDRCGQWPQITADALLPYLAPEIDVPPRWKKCLVSFALLLLELQRARRLLRFALDGLNGEFSNELENEGCDGWKAEDYPEWLLIQIQGNFLIRRTQAETAMEMMSPKSRGNTVMQVNSGEGKSSIIIPIAAAALADGKQLVRVVVPKVLTVQMFELLVARLGGLANRPIYHLPFSRIPKDDNPDNEINTEIHHLQRLMSQCMAEHGILLVQPEHVVSLKLMSVEEQICEGILAADPLPKPQKLIYKHITTALSLNSLRKHSLVGNIFQSLSQSLGYSSKTRAAQANHHEERNDAHSTSDSAFKWLSLQKWIHSHARDILDENDEILHPRFHLIYTIGLEQHMDGYPDRWTITQQVLRLVKECARTLSRDHANSIEL